MNSLFNGTIYFANIEFTVQNQGNKVMSVSDADMNTAISYATQAAVPISLYAAQYGQASISISQNPIPYKVNIADPSIDDGHLQSWVNDIALNLPNNCCVVVLLPPEIDNSSMSRSNGTGGYHSSANVSYINSYIFNDREGTPALTVQDKTFRYAGALSHEIAEMVVNPRGGNPEVCDPCGPNFVSTYLDYFDYEGNYLTTTQTPPYDPNLGFDYNFYINGIVQPEYAKGQAAPAAACSYSPVPVGIATLASLPNSLCCDGFFSKDDNYRHAIVGASDGDVSELFYNPAGGSGVAKLATTVGLLDVGAFYTPDDGNRHVITVSVDGTINETFYNPNSGLGQTVIGNIQNAQRVCGFYSDDDQFRHAIVSTSNGDVFEIFYHPTKGTGQSLLTNVANITDIGCFYSSDDNYRHVIVGTNNGNISEIYYNPATGQGQGVIANVNNATCLSAYYVENALYNRRVQIATSGGGVQEIRYNPNVPTIKFRLSNQVPILDIGGFFSSDDGARHAIMLLPSGDVKELFYNI